MDSDSVESEESEDQEAQDIRIKPPSTPEINPEVYQEVVPLLEHGFLMLSADMNGVPFVFKSLNHHEYERVRLLSGFLPNSPTVPPRFWDLFLAYMVLFVDGQNILLDRNRHLAALADTFKELPNSAKTKLIRQLSELNRKTAQAIRLVEAYATESYSRWRWAQVQGLDLSSPALTGIEGTERLGLSYAQLTWRALNYYEDLKTQQEANWENSKFIGGCFAGKGIQKIYDQDARRRKREKEEMWTRKDQLIRNVLFNEPLEQNKRYGGAQVIIVASTVEELADQVEKSLRGEKDWHDKIVDEYESKIRQGVKNRESQLQELVASRHDSRSVEGETQLQGLTPQQVLALLEDQKQRLLAAQQQPVSGLTDETTRQNLMKWGYLKPETPPSNSLQPPPHTGKSRRRG